MDHSELYRRMGVHCNHKDDKHERPVKAEHRQRLNEGGMADAKKLLISKLKKPVSLAADTPVKKAIPVSAVGLKTAKSFKKGGHCK